MFRPDREPRGEDPLLLVKITLFAIASVVAFTGMALQRPLVISAAIVLLGVGFLLRFLWPRGGDAPDSGDAAADAADDDVPPSDRPST
jgi:hypothetical protein